MNTHLEFIFTRRSIRRFSGERVTDEQLKLILTAGMTAPSANNQQPWEFIVVDDRGKMGQIMKVHPYSQMLSPAPVCIIVAANLKKSLYKDMDWWIQDCAAATENILLAVNALGLGAVWVGVYPNWERVAAIRKIFDIPEDVVPFSIIPIGHAAETRPPKKDYQASLVHRNKW
ncbi:MAG: nitroreductase [Peptococcaceae bacterium]|jgi:nitroreductase|nr:nitroreductase [Peptococcaceae bacterium]